MNSTGTMIGFIIISKERVMVVHTPLWSYAPIKKTPLGN